MKPCLLLPGSLAGLLLTWLLASGCRPSPREDPGPRPDATGAEAAWLHTEAILSHGPRPPQSAALNKVRAYLIDQLRQSGWHSAMQTFEQAVLFPNPVTGQVDTRPVTFRNLIARFGSPDDPDLWSRPVEGVLGAHLDSKYFPDRRFVGADDAASAVGVILELARQLGATPERASRLELVFFDGEEAFGPDLTAIDGLYGSKAYAKRWRSAESMPSFGIVLDMIGHRNLQVRYPSDTPAHLERHLLDAARTEGVQDRYRQAPGPILDDHVPLNDAGIPTIDIIGDFTSRSWWHTEADDLGLISRHSLDITLRVTARMLEDLLPAP